VVVDRDLPRSETQRAALAVEQINTELRKDGRRFVLIGPGRWGSRDPWLGIPVTWPQISAARAIVETDFDDLQVEPSFGSHFFHNLTCFGVAFFAIHAAEGSGHIDWRWFEEQQPVSVAMDGAVRHIRLREPLQVLVDGEVGTGVILEK
jgi:hypothetical protein